MNLLLGSVTGGKDVSPISFKSLVAARQASSQVWSFFLRCMEFRTIRPVEFYRIAGAGYRVCAWSSLPFDRLHLLPKKWLRRWLISHHPRSPNGLPWEWWLAAGRRKPISIEVIGILDNQLRMEWESSLEGEGWSLDKDVLDERGGDCWEEHILRPWVSLYCNSLHSTCSRVMAGERIDPYLDRISVPRDRARSSSGSLPFRWSLSFRLYDRVTSILTRALPLLLTEGPGPPGCSLGVTGC